ncbi:MAG: GWxTD domain-containing protein [Bacteroidetes bacterium]|nr:GWxTD domain-containing protein [Bacteroidota bacterium]
MKYIGVLTIYIFLVIQNNFAQKNSDYTELYKKAVLSINEMDTASALKHLLDSVEKFGDVQSYYRLAVLYQQKNTSDDLRIARDYIIKAIEKDDKNIAYHLMFASILERLFVISEFEFDARSRAFLEYEKILEIDSTFSFAWYKLGEFKRQDFNEFNQSYLRVESNISQQPTSTDTEEFGQLSPTYKDNPAGFENDRAATRQMGVSETREMMQMNAFLDENSPLLSYEGAVEDDLLDAEIFLKKAIETNPKNYNARLELGFLYEDADMPEEGIPIFEELVDENSLDKDAHLFLALLNYESGNIDQAYESFQNALSLMPNDEFKDYTFYSVLLLLEPILGDRASTFGLAEMKIFIDAFWRVRDPFNLTEYNERILEHYARVAYANLRFSIPSRNISGWQTDMGEMMIRYGDPPARKRFRQGVVQNDFSMYHVGALNYDYLTSSGVKTEVWYFNDVAIAFTDEFSTGEYKYHDPYARSRRSFAQFYQDPNTLGKNLVNKKPESYTPKLHGGITNLPYNAIQFKGENGKTDVYVNYALEYNEKYLKENLYQENHDVGLFFFDKHFHKLFEKRKKVPTTSSLNKIQFTDTTGIVVNSLTMNLSPVNGNCAFEYKNNEDNKVASYHGTYRVRDFMVDTLSISDILVGSAVEPLGGTMYPIHRGEFGLLPNPGHVFTNKTDLFLYFEIYNLKKAEDGLTNFEQTIEVIEFQEEINESLFSLIGSFFDLIGLTGNDQIELTSSYQTLEENPQNYLQLDLSDYDPGKYLIRVKIKDVITQQTTQTESLIIWE